MVQFSRVNQEWAGGSRVWVKVFSAIGIVVFHNRKWLLYRISWRSSFDWVMGQTLGQKLFQLLPASPHWKRASLLNGLKVVAQFLWTFDDTFCRHWSINIKSYCIYLVLFLEHPISYCNWTPIIIVVLFGTSNIFWMLIPFLFCHPFR